MIEALRISFALQSQHRHFFQRTCSNDISKAGHEGSFFIRDDVLWPTLFYSKCLFSLFITQFRILRFKKFNPICLTFVFCKNTMRYRKYFTLESAQDSTIGFSTLRCLISLVFREYNCSNPMSVQINMWYPRIFFNNPFESLTWTFVVTVVYLGFWLFQHIFWFPVRKIPWVI